MMLTEPRERRRKLFICRPSTKRIRWVALLEAQALVLNPKSFLDHKWPGGKNQAREEIQKRPIESWELKFTRNVVQVVLRGREFHNLIVTDLPGLIQSTDTREDE